MRSRALLVAGGVVASAVAVSFGVASSRLEDSILRAEQVAVDERAEDAVGWLGDEGAALVGAARDYAEWDDTWAYVRGESPDYLQTSLTPETWPNLRLERVLLATPDRVVLAQRWTEDGAVALTDEEARHLASLDGGAAGWGLVKSPQGALMYATVPVTRSDRTGADGTRLVFARRVDAALPVAERLARSALVLVPPEGAVAPAPAGRVVGVATVSAPGASGWRVRAEREVRPPTAALQALVAAGLAVGGFSLLTTLALLDAFVLRRLVRFTTELAAIRDGERRRLSAEGDDELDRLGQGVNDLMAHLDVAQARLQEQALHDALTGLANRTLLHDRLEQALARARRSGRKVALLFVDLDHFKMINDHLGHPVGDRFLVSVAERLRVGLRPEDTVARVGGDEFAIVLEDLATLDPAVRAADRVLQALRVPIVHAEASYEVSASVGVAFSEPDSTVQGLLSAADTAMYAAKQSGRDRSAVYDAAMHGEVMHRLELHRALRLAIHNGEIGVWFQPIVAAADGQLVGFEALARWLRPGVGPMEAGGFVAIAEEASVVAELDERVLELALAHFAPWRARLPRLVLTVNQSARRFDLHDLPARVRSACREASVPTEALILEISEVLHGPNEARWKEGIALLAQSGVRLALDDFGAGCSSLGRLRESVALLKLDRSFVEELEAGREEVACAVLGLAGTLRLPVVAEGVESEAAAARLRELGCAWLQGWNFAPALPPEEAAQWVIRAAARPPA